MEKFVDYERPPLVEVASGLSFDAVRALKAPHFGLFWARVQKDLPAADHAPPLGLSDALSVETEGVFPLPRMWLINDPKGELLQLQRDRFVYNWRAGPEKVAYGGYTAIFAAFRTYWEKYVAFLASVGIPRPEIRECELTYFNHIPQRMGWKDMADVGKLIPSLGWKGEGVTMLATPKQMLSSAVFQLPDTNGDLVIKLQPATSAITREPVLSLELSAKGRGKDASDKGIAAWFQLAHEWIVKSFADLVDAGFQKDVFKRVK